MDELGMQEERDKQAFVQVLLDQEVLEGAALGIATLLVDQGYSVLSEKQERILEQYVLQEHRVQECSLDGEPISWADQADAYDSELCSQCTYRLDKLSRDD